MSPLGKDIHVTAQTGFTQPSLRPAAGGNVTATIFFLFFHKVSACFHEFNLVKWEMSPHQCPDPQ